MGSDNSKSAAKSSQSKNTSGHNDTHEQSTFQPETQTQHSAKVNNHYAKQNQTHGFRHSNELYPDFPTSSDSSNGNEKFFSNNVKRNEQQNDMRFVLVLALDISILLELSNNESSQVINFLKDHKLQFKKTIQEPISNTSLVVLMKIIRKILLSDSDFDRMELLKIVSCDNLLNSLSNYILTLPTRQQNSAKENLLFLEENVLPFLETICFRIPSLMYLRDPCNLRNLLINTNLAINGLEQYHKVKFDNETRIKLKKMESIVNCHTNSNTLEETVKPESSPAPKSKNQSEDTQQNVKASESRGEQAQAKHMSFLTRNVFPEVVKKLDVPVHRVRGIRRNIFFIDRGAKDEDFVKDTEFLLLLAKYLLKQKYESNDIILLTTNETMMKNIGELKNKHTSLKNMPVGVINNNENTNVSIVLIYFAIGGLDPVQNVYEERQLCKVFLGAKNGIFMTGSLPSLAKQSLFWKQMKDLLQQHQATSSELPLLCEIHQTVTYVSERDDFKKHNNGGCLKCCEQQLCCGHHCKRQCHLDDREHKYYKCREPCLRKPDHCSMSHKCPNLCFEICGLCNERVNIKNRMKLCHELFNQQKVKGSSSDSQHATGNGKQSLMPCGHEAAKEIISGHRLDRWSIELTNLCKVPCTAVLECNHTCTGTCGSCRMGQVHMPCRDKRKITLACGHRCFSTCSSPVEYCNQKCFYECPHGKCKEKCGVPCTPCKEICAIGCEHSKCTKKCFEMCDRRPCCQPCKKLLACGHQCIGLCGELCPKFCRVCNAQELKKWDSSGHARFIHLSNCQHVVRCNDLDRKAFQGVQKIEALACPICGFNITKTTRYLNYAKELHRNLCVIRSVQKQYTDNLTSAFWKIAKELRLLSLSSDIENNPKIEEIKKHFQAIKEKGFADHKSMILLLFIRNVIYPVMGGHTGMTSPNHLDWLLYLLLERYEMGFCTQVLRELYKEVIDFQKLKGTVYKKSLLELHKAIAFFTYLEKDTWSKCTQGHLATYNSLLTECSLCDGILNNE